MPTRREQRFSQASGRWAGIGPYYAMFPIDFASKIIKRFSKPGDRVLDPFAGRASSIYTAASENRLGLGIEINPVGWIYGKVKLNPAAKQKVIDRLNEIQVTAKTIAEEEANNMPEFFRHCYAKNVLVFLLAARKYLNWKTNQTDATVMAIILVYLHGKRGQALSNQMRQTKAMSPEYSIRWWKSKGSVPPEIDPVEFLTSRIEWRYAKGAPRNPLSQVILGDAILVLKKLKFSIKNKAENRFDLLFTSPPYYNLANYHYDQWLRLWMLQGPSSPVSLGSKWQGKFSSTTNYQYLLSEVFNLSAKLLNPEAVVYVRTDARPFTLKTTINALTAAFPQKNMRLIKRPFNKATQTALFGDKRQKPGEIDIILQ